MKHQRDKVTAFSLMREETRRQIRLPWSEAFKISWRYLTVRIGRSFITVSTVFFSVAFLMSVFTMVTASKATGREIDLPTIARYKWLVSMGLLICSIGIINALLMSVTERFREIGTMKCLGALDAFIIRLFLIEVSLMGLFGSITGALIGMSVMLVWSSFKEGFDILGKIDWGIRSDTRDLGMLGYFLVSVGCGTIISIISAIIPAWRAARLQAADALRTEI